MANFKFFVGTRLEDLQTAANGRRVAMLDGTVPGWQPGARDKHFDHHRKGGAKTQIEEMFHLWPAYSEVGQAYWTGENLIATTQLDADACVAAAYLVAGGMFSPEAMDRLIAIAYDCDHLGVPEDLAQYADFAFKAVAALKLPIYRDRAPIALGLAPEDSKNWTEEQKLAVSAESYRLSTILLVNAALGLCPWPGESGEADDYAKNIDNVAKWIIAENRVSEYRGCAIGDGREREQRYIDPRCFYAAWEFKKIPRKFTLTYRFHKNEGLVYTVACAGSGIDLTDGYFDALTALERKNNPNADGWGGRETVGGSGWNTPTTLSPEEVIDCLLAHEKCLLES